MRNIISLGDSSHEREAIIRATAGLASHPGVRIKSLKLKDLPEIDDLQREQDLVRSCLEHLVQHDGNFDLCLNASEVCELIL